jgi:serine/threonine protein kinase
MGVSALMIMSHMGDALNQLFNPSYPLPMLDVEIVASIVQTAQALQYVHEQGFLHRDIKPSNIFLGEDNFTRLADFGLCMKPDDVHYLFTGTPMYMSRQQARGDGPSTEQDIWSLGNTAIHMLTKEYPFDMTKHPKIAQNTLLPNYESPNHNQNIFAAKFFPLGGVLNQVNKRDPRTWPTLSLIIQAGKQYMSLQGYEHPAIS